MKRIKFTRAYQVKAKDGETYEAGQVVELNDASAKHFLDRGAAVEAGDEPRRPEPRRPEPKAGEAK